MLCIHGVHIWCVQDFMRCIQGVHEVYTGCSRVVYRVIMVLGAGRGPLVSAAIRASLQAARKIKVYAVEKNPNAVVTYVISVIAFLCGCCHCLCVSLPLSLSV